MITISFDQIKGVRKLFSMEGKIFHKKGTGGQKHSVKKHTKMKIYKKNSKTDYFAGSSGRGVKSPLRG